MDKNKAISGYEKIFDDGYKAGRASVVLPHPCDGERYAGWLSSDYFAKIAEEHLEVIDAYKAIEKSGKCPTKEEKDHFFKECTDLIVATTGLMHYFGCDEKTRQQYMKEINESNAKRDGGKRFASFRPLTGIPFLNPVARNARLVRARSTICGAEQQIMSKITVSVTVTSLKPLWRLVRCRF